MCSVFNVLRISCSESDGPSWSNTGPSPSQIAAQGGENSTQSIGYWFCLPEMSQKNFWSFGWRLFCALIQKCSQVNRICFKGRWGLGGYLQSKRLQTISFNLSFSLENEKFSCWCCCQASGFTLRHPQWVRLYNCSFIYTNLAKET